MEEAKEYYDAFDGSIASILECLGINSVNFEYDEEFIIKSDLDFDFVSKNETFQNEFITFHFNNYVLF